jgi:peptide/nickel transport system substrate-binding protein
MWSRRIALASALTLAVGAAAATRPHYGGGLRIGMAERVTSLDPAAREGDRGAGIARMRIMPLLFETLVKQQPDGTLRPGLARYWTSSANFRHWQFWVRSGVNFHDGTALTADLAARSLNGAMADCTARASGEMLVMDCQSPHPALAAELTAPERAIVRRTPNSLEGTGPFVVAQWQPGQRLVISAWEQYWGGRPYLDSIEITFAQPERDQLLALQLGRTDIAELGTGDAARSDIRGQARVASTPPIELMTLNFSRSSRAVADPRIREALSFAADRDAIANKLLQREAQPAASLVPGWISGYGSAFTIAGDASRARELVTEVREPSGAPLPPITLQYDSADALSRLVAERIAVDARAIGLPVQTIGTPGAAPDVTLERIALESLDPAAALIEVASELRLPAPAIADDSLEAVYRAESALLSERWVAPVIFVKRSWAIAARVRNWMLPPDGGWRADELWIANDGVATNAMATHEQERR